MARKTTRVLTEGGLGMRPIRPGDAQNKTMTARMPSRIRATTPARRAASVYERLQVAEETCQCDGSDADCAWKNWDAITPS